MNLLWDQEPVVAANDFSPFSGEVALPVGAGDASRQVLAPLTPAAGTRPRRRSLLEIGLAHGQGADALEAKACKADADRRQADRAAGVDQDGADIEASEDGKDVPAEAPSVEAIAAVTEEIRSTLAESQLLSGELEELKVRETELRVRLMAMLNGGGMRGR